MLYAVPRRPRGARLPLRHPGTLATDHAIVTIWSMVVVALPATEVRHRVIPSRATGITATLRLQSQSSAPQLVLWWTSP